MFCRKSDSIVFPDSEPKTLPNLIRFVLSHATSDLRLDTLLDVCNKQCLNYNKAKISYSLQKLQKRSRRYLQHLKTIISHVSSVVDKVKGQGNSENSAENQMENIHKSEISNLYARIELVQNLIVTTNRKIKKMIQLKNYLSNHKGSPLSKRVVLQQLNNISE